MMNWCDKNHIGYIIGIARNARIEELANPLIVKALFSRGHEMGFGSEAGIISEFERPA